MYVLISGIVSKMAVPFVWRVTYVVGVENPNGIICSLFFKNTVNPLPYLPVIGAEAKIDFHAVRKSNFITFWIVS